MYAAGGAWSAAFLQFVAGVILVRSLAPSDVGTFVFGSAIAILVFGIADIRIEEGLTQFLVREENAQRENHTRAALRFAVAVDLASGLLIFTLLFAALSLLPFDLSGDTTTVAAIAAATSFIGTSDGSFLAVLYARHAFGWLSTYQIVGNTTRCLTLLILPITTPVSAAWAFLLAQVVGTGFVIAVVVLRFLPHRAQSSRLDSTVRRWLLGFSVHVAAASAVATIRANATPLLMGVLGTRREVADTRVAESPTKLLGVAVAPLRTVLFPRLSAAWARRDRPDARRLIRQYVAAALLLGGGLGLALALGIDFLLTRIYGPPYSDLGRVGQLFVLAALLEAVAGWQKVAPAALDRPWLRTYILVGESGALLVGLFILVPPYGPLGAAVSATVAATCSLAMGAYWLRPAFTKKSWENPRAFTDVGKDAHVADRPS
jgi:O-antigen/teichoic acid export membrane protein